MSCLCGDPACPSCGPAQGYCPKCVMDGKDECDCPDGWSLPGDFMDEDELYERQRQQEIDDEAFDRSNAASDESGSTG